MDIKIPLTSLPFFRAVARPKSKWPPWSMQGRSWCKMRRNPWWLSTANCDILRGYPTKSHESPMENFISHIIYIYGYGGFHKWDPHKLCLILMMDPKIFTGWWLVGTPMSLLKPPHGELSHKLTLQEAALELFERVIHSVKKRVMYVYTGWWFGTFFIFPYIGNNHPNWLIFFRGVQTTNQYTLYIIICKKIEILSI